MPVGFIDPVLSFTEWVARKQKSPARSRRRCGLRRQTQEPPRKDTFGLSIADAHPHSFYKIQSHVLHSKSKRACEQLLHNLNGICVDVADVVALRRLLRTYSKGPKKATVRIAMIGGQGIGKSSVLNALLNRLNLANVSDDTKACTQHATTYEHLPGAPDNIDKSNVTIKFLDAANLERNTRENITRYADCHFPTLGSMDTVATNSERDSDSDSDSESLEQAPEHECTKVPTQEELDLAATSMEIFRIIFDTRNDPKAEHILNSHLNAESISDGTLLRLCLEKQNERIQKVGANEEGVVVFENVSDKLGINPKAGDIDIKKARYIAADMWPLIDMVTIATGSVLLRNGIVFIDLPGTGDSNSSRTAITNTIRRGADYEIIVSIPKRLEDDKVVAEQVRRSEKAHGLDHTILVANQLDINFKTGESEVRQVVYDVDDPPFRQIRDSFESLQQYEDADNTADIDRYHDYLEALAIPAVKRRKAGVLENSMKAKFGSQVNFLPITASSYLEWLDPERDEDPDFGPKMSGVPHFQEFLLGLVAPMNQRRYEEHYGEDLPELIDMCNSILDKYKIDDVDAFARFHDSLSILSERLEGSTCELVATAIAARVPPILSYEQVIEVKQRILSLLKSWGDQVPFHSHNYALGKNGIPALSKAKAWIGKDINWNRDLLEIIEKPAIVQHKHTSPRRFIAEWKNAMLGQSSDIATTITSSILDALQTVSSIITTTLSVDQDLQRHIVNAWNKTKERIRQMTLGYEAAIEAAITETYRAVTIEEDIGCMIAKLNKEIYYKATRVDPGKHRYKRQKRYLRARLLRSQPHRPDFVHRYQDAVLEELESALRGITRDLFKQACLKLDEFVLLTRRFVQTDAYQTEEYEQVRQVLKDWLPDFHDAMVECQREVYGNQHQEDLMFLKAVKRRRTDENATPFGFKVEE